MPDDTQHSDAFTPRSVDELTDAERQDILTFVSKLTEEEKMLIVLQSELYEGSWQAMISDLNNRLDGRPYIFKLANRIKDDIARIDKLTQFEQHYHIHLADFVAQSSQQ